MTKVIIIFISYPSNIAFLFPLFFQGMKSYQAQQLYPMQVAELQKIEPKITGGCTAVLAVIADKHLYVANVGDSRAILIKERHDGTLHADQLSVDHCVENEDELTRLEQLGLNRENLKRAGRLGMQENTRSIGDYYIKGGYKDVDTLVQVISTYTPQKANIINLVDIYCVLVVSIHGVLHVYFADTMCTLANVSAKCVLISWYVNNHDPPHIHTDLQENLQALPPLM